MNNTFADTSYYVALLNPDDDAHEMAIAFTTTLKGQVITSEWVLAELGGRLCDPRNRELFIELIDEIGKAPEVVVVNADSQSFRSGVELFSRLSDKEWSLVDCISFEIMRSRGIMDALTTDHHFEQAGFASLLK